MARTILGSTTQQTLSTSLTPFTRTSPSTNTLTQQEIDARLRQKRSKTYIEAIQKLDAGGHVHSRESVEALLAAIRQELPEISIDFLPLGFVSKCYLGAPYEVHTLDRVGNIICHYKMGQGLPNNMERARELAKHAGYAFIEVYPDKLIAVTANGDISLVKG